ncbi:MAG: 2-C-methyl-D-erythritol 4-phosphate cytidylyltransferase [Candidatus Hydrogenedentes bacterium]|nr:2-C-methyl-D-erythritol 4-phosphate cytidylyltransferase [Candidatus Hydrogenedentota bacterium]
MRAQLVIPAAGMGTRLGAQGPKALVELLGTPLLVHTLRRFEPLHMACDAVVVAPIEFLDTFQAAIDAAYDDHKIQLVPGGAERQESVDRGLAALRSDTEIAVIHDAARPFIGAEAVRAAIEAAAEFGAATVAVPAVDTILQADADAFLESTPDRSQLWSCQTPQVFRVEVIREAHARARAEGHLGTDDASLVRRLGGRVKLVPGSAFNFKITRPEDLVFARAVLQEGLA